MQKLEVCWRSGKVLKRAVKACRMLAESCSTNGYVLSGQCTCARIRKNLIFSIPVFLQDQLVELQEAIGTSLEYFQELEHATRLLNHPGESLVLQTDFLYMVERVDICIEFLKSHVCYYYGSRVCLSFRLFCIPPGRLGNSEITRRQKYTSCVFSNV